MNNQQKFFDFKKFVTHDEDKMRQNYFNNLAENHINNQIKMKLKVGGDDSFQNIKLIIFYFRIKVVNLINKIIKIK